MKENDNWPMTVGDLDNDRAFYTLGIDGNRPDKVFFNSLEDARTAIAFAQLSRLLWHINKGWRPDWRNEKQTKFFILYNNTKKVLEVSSCQFMQSLPNCLYFTNEEHAQRSMETHKELWMCYLQKNKQQNT